MNTRKTEKMTNSRLFNKGILPVAVATAMFGAGVAQAVTIGEGGPESVTVSTNVTANYWVSNNGTLVINNNGGQMQSFYGTIDGSNLSTSTNGSRAGSARGNVTITAANGLTLYGDVGATNGTGNMTLEAGSTLYLADNMTTFRTTTLTIGTGSTVYTGNNASQ